MTLPTYSTGEEPLPGDLVRRTGESVKGLTEGWSYTVLALDETGWPMFRHIPEASFRPRGFSLVQRKEGES